MTALSRMHKKKLRKAKEANAVAKKEVSQPDTKGSEDDALESLSERVITAIDTLDDNVAAHWTRSGLPSMKAIEELVGDSRITRDYVESLSSRKRKPKSER